MLQEVNTELIDIMYQLLVHLYKITMYVINTNTNKLLCLVSDMKISLSEMSLVT